MLALVGYSTASLGVEIIKGVTMLVRSDLQEIVIEALNSLGGQGTIVEVAKHIWEKYKEKLEKSGDLFYTWQYDMRWAATKLRNENIILPAEVSQKGQWRLAK